MIRTLIALTITSILAAPAYAENSESEDERKGSYWELAFAGGMLVPLGDMSDLHQQSLAGNVRISWVSSLGLGLDLAVDYSPLSRRQLNPDDVYEIHFASAGLMPRFTLGRNVFRVWLAAGGGMAFEHVENVANGGVAGLEPTISRVSAAGMGAAGVELHAFSGVGLAVIGSYTRTYGDVDYQMLNVTGGLAVTFD